MQSPAANINRAIPVFYRPEMIGPTASNGPGLWKARYLMNMIEGEPECSIHGDFGRATRGQLLEVHDSNYIDPILSRNAVNGHGNKCRAALDAILYQNGSILAAAEYVMTNGGCALSPTSGFHHAGRDYGGGFCTFNGLMLAAYRAVKDSGKRVLIIDGDGHFGDGCLDILPSTSGVDYTSTAHRTPEEFMQSIRDHSIGGHSLVLYQAGADSHKDDSYGAGKYTTQQLIDRDSLVFSLCKKHGVPVVWDLAGGYGAPEMSNTLKLHYNTWRAAVEVFC